MRKQTQSQLDNLEKGKWQPGKSGNPAGRPVGIENAKTRYLRLLTLTEKMKNPVTGKIEEFSIIEQLDLQIINKARKGDLAAYREIMDRLEGRPAQSVDMTSQGRELQPMVFFDLSPPEDEPKGKVKRGKSKTRTPNKQTKRTPSGSKKPKV